MTSRRKFLEATATAGVGALLPWRAHAQTAAALTAVAAPPAAGAVISPILAKWLTTLPQPGTAAPVGTHTYNVTDPITGLPVIDPVTGVVQQATAPLYDFSMVALTQSLHPSLGVATGGTPVWGYKALWTDGVVRPFYPGPTIEATRGQAVAVRWSNNLPATYLIPGVIDNTLDGMIDPTTGLPLPAVRVVSHRHGGEQPSAIDGIPHQWYVQSPPVAGDPYPTGGTGSGFKGDLYVYPNDQTPTTLWYHDHAMGVTRTNVYAGLAGFWLLRDPNEASLGLPSGKYEYPLAIQDRTFNRDGTLYYPPAPIQPEVFGDTIVVNSQVWPKLAADPKRYRFRLLNGCTARFLRMRFIETDATGKPLTKNKKIVQGPSLWQIGTDGGFLPAPVEIGTALNPIVIGPGERYDVLVDFGGADALGVPWAGRFFLMYNDAGTPFSNTPSTKGAIPEIFLVAVGAAGTGGADTSTPIANLTLPAAPLPNPAAAVRTRNITLNELMLGKGLVTAINGVGYMSNPLTMAPAAPTEMPKVGDTEIWNLVNMTVDTHPIHLHHSMFRIVKRQAIDPLAYAAADALVAPGDPNRPDPFQFLLPGSVPLPPAANEAGLKDTVRANPAEVVQFAITFNTYAGEYVYHCHILEHEEHDMMRPLIVQPPAIA
ncbi:MAG TPA: multicopper oxidase domain-containing protein [Gemmatimonadaceae bacterium]|nr:multicopper oxidase domain-containing protein [Gemmatimonadaceae bacterium]